jgi:hypothetical protein
MRCRREIRAVQAGPDRVHRIFAVALGAACGHGGASAGGIHDAFGLLAYLDVFWRTLRWIRVERGLDCREEGSLRKINEAARTNI